MLSGGIARSASCVIVWTFSVGDYPLVVCRNHPTASRRVQRPAAASSLGTTRLPGRGAG